MDPVDTPAEGAQPDVQSTPAAPAAAGPMTGAPAATPAQPPAAPSVPSPAAQVVAHQSQLGKIAMAAMGKQVSYQADPQTGIVTPVVQQRSFSDFARNLVGGLLLGGAIGAKAGAQAGGSPLAAGVAGAQGVNAQQQQQDQDARQQAVQQMKEQQGAAKGNQDLEDSRDRDALTKAQIAHSNLTTLQLNQAIQRQGYEDHDRLAQTGKANVQPFVDAGLKPIFEDIPESQMEQTIKNYPGASALDWTHTGMVTGADLSKATGLDVEQTGEHPVEGPDGQTHYESTFTAYDPKGEVPLSQQTLSQWKQDGFLQSLGTNAQSVLKPDMQMPAQQYIALKNQHEKFQLQAEQQRQHNVQVQKDQDAHNAAVALAASRQGTANKNNAQADKVGGGEGPGTSRGSSAATLKGLSSDEYKSLVDMVGTGQADPGSLLRYGKGDQEKLLADAKLAHPGFDPTTFQARLGVAKSFASGKDANAIQSFNQLVGHVGETLEAANTLSNTGSPLLNRPFNELKTLTGDPKLSGLLVPMFSARTEFMNFLNNNHALSEADKDDARKIMSENMTPAQFLTQAKQIMGASAVRLDTLNDKYRNTMGRDYPGLMNPRTQQALRGAGYGDTVDRLTSTPNPRMHNFSVSAWQKANPKGDVNAITALAKSKGLKVVP